MSHIAEVYAKDLGVKIGSPVITEHFYPGLPDNYITIQASNKMPAANYLYWEIVVSLIKPYLGDLKILQVGGPEDKPIRGIDYSTLGCSYKQMNYVIKKSKAHVGCDSLPGHIASTYDIPSVILHFNLYKENSKPIWHKNNSCTSLEPDFSKVKPSFGTNCQRINEIKPEKIAQAILDQLDIEQKIKFKTIKAGSRFAQETFDIVPNFFGYSKELEGKPVNIRGDLHFDLAHISNWCRMCIVNLYISEIFDTEVLQYMPNLKQVVYKYNEHEETDISEFFKILKNKKINVFIQAQDKAQISDIRLKYFDFMVVEEPEPHEEIKAAKFISSKKFISNAEVFISESSAKRLDKSNNFVYDEASSKELESLYLYDEE
jgi:ADP-heptose:LPS heptosyltransferase